MPGFGRIRVLKGMHWAVFWLLPISLAWAGEPMCAKVASSLRKAPGSQSPVSWRVGKFMPLMRLESKNGWAKVQDLDGEIHWVKNSEITSEFSCVVVRVNSTSLRKLPADNAPPADLRTLDRFTPLKKLSVEGEWMQVEFEGGRKGWLQTKSVWKPVNVQAVSF